MWQCPLCGQKFVRTNQAHSCQDRQLSDFLAGKSEHTVALFWSFIEKYREVGKITVHATKSMIAIAGKTRLAYVTRLGKDFVDVTFPFSQPYTDNLCFTRIAQVPGTSQYNHHLRLMSAEDLNEEVLEFMKLAYNNNS